MNYLQTLAFTVASMQIHVHGMGGLLSLLRDAVTKYPGVFELVDKDKVRTENYPEANNFS